MSIGQKIKEARKSRGLTQKQLAALIGVSPGAICNYEKNFSSPGEDIILRLMSALEIDANFLYGDLVNEMRARQRPVSETEAELLDLYRDAEPMAQEMALDLLRRYQRKKGTLSAAE